MDELIGRPAVKAGVNDAVTEKTIGIISGFLRNEGPCLNVQALIAGVPGAEPGTKLLGVGGTIRIQNIAHELFRFGYDKIGTDGTAEIAATPRLSQLA